MRTWSIPFARARGNVRATLHNKILALRFALALICILKILDGHLVLTAFSLFCAGQSQDCRQKLTLMHACRRMKNSA